MYKQLNMLELVTVFTLLISCLSILILPGILYILDGSIRESLSQYVLNPNTYWYFKGILSTVFISFIFRKKYIVPSILILGVIFFDVNQYNLTHNIFAGFFFLYLTVLMCIDKPVYLGYLMVLNGMTLITLGLYYFEVIGILIIVTYQIIFIYRLIRYKVLKK